MQVIAYISSFILTLLFLNGVYCDPMDDDQSSSSSSSKKLIPSPFETPFESSEHRDLYAKAANSRAGAHREGVRRIEEIQKLHPIFQGYDQSKLQDLQEKSKKLSHDSERAKVTPIVKPKNGN